MAEIDRGSLFRVKPVAEIEAEEGQLTRSMGPVSLLMLSVGAMVGTGIFVILGEAVPQAGPAILLSFVLGAVAAAFSALSYAELAGAIPVSGSSYSYAYATLGEVVAWAVGWMLMLEYGVAVAAVAVGWGEYLNEFLVSFGLQLPLEWTNPPGEDGGIVNLPAVAVILLATALLLRGAKESARVNAFMVMLKILILVFFSAIAFTAFDPGNLTPFMPLGVAGVTAAAGQVFFSYIGFDAAATAGEESRNPRRDIPIAIIGGLVIVTLLYLMVTLAAIGARNWTLFSGAGGEAALAAVARQVTGGSWAPTVIAVGAIVSIFSVVLVMLYGQTRILFAMSRDGLLPPVFSRLSARTDSPRAATLIVVAVVATTSALVPLGNLAEAVSIGTLGAFLIVNIGVIQLRRSRPDLPRRFRTPLFPLTPILGILFILSVASGLHAVTWMVFAIWMTVGMTVYVMYSRRHSVLAGEPAHDGPHRS